jgi:hypothetical protein
MHVYHLMSAPLTRGEATLEIPCQQGWKGIKHTYLTNDGRLIRGQAVPIVGQAVPSEGQAVPIVGQAVPFEGQAVPSEGQAAWAGENMPRVPAACLQGQSLTRVYALA